MKILLVLALPLLVVWGSTGTNVKDSLTLRVFNKDLSLSDVEMHKILEKAGLERHGYLKEMTTTDKITPSNSKPDHVKTLFYYKVVRCDKVMEVEKELNRLLDGILGSGVARKAYKDVSERKVYSGKHCKAGLEVHFRSQQSCGQKKGPRVKRLCVGMCIFCLRIGAEE